MADPKRCDYEGTDYESDFWLNTGREYEDSVERIALTKMLPAHSGWLIEVGAGYGRLADLYEGRSEHVVLLDYSPSLVEKAARRWSTASNMTFVVGDLYNLPFADGLFDVAVMVRVLHHVEAVPPAFREVRRIMRPGGRYLLEYANKRHLKAIVRYLLRRQQGNPFSLEPSRLDELYFNYHPAFVESSLRRAGFSIVDELAVSFFRLQPLKSLLDPQFLAALDDRLQAPMRGWKVTPSIFLKAAAVGTANTVPGDSRSAIWRCPNCHQAGLEEQGGSMHCLNCGTKWDKRRGIYYFR
ncbi:MAG: class I SAM-dependent methyltransferase [Chloroflexi bacterium]|nr:class I SAM-dependent methyltransferase [Chloroflexota bacterium]